MIRLYSGSGARDIELDGQEMHSDRWNKLRAMSIKMLRSRGHAKAAKILEDTPFGVCGGYNGFGDAFSLLYWRAPFEEYEVAGAWSEDPAYRAAFEQIAKTVAEVTGLHIRFVAVELDTNETLSAVSTPNLQTTSDVVDRALKDAEHLLSTTGATSGVDRVHTALHGYLKVACDKNAIAYPADPTIAKLFKLLR